MFYVGAKTKWFSIVIAEKKKGLSTIVAGKTNFATVVK